MAGTYIRQTGEPLIDQSKGWGAVSFDPSSPAFGGVLATSRRLFEIKKAKIAEQMAGIESWTPEKRAKFLSRKQSFYRHLLKDEDLRRNPDLVEFALSEPLLGPVTQYLGMVPYLTREDREPAVSSGSRGAQAGEVLHLRLRRRGARRPVHVPARRHELPRRQ
jgi:hypothetical protein